MAKLIDKMFNRVIEGELEAQDEIKSEVEALRDNGELSAKGKITIVVSGEHLTSDELELTEEQMVQIKKFKLYKIKLACYYNNNPYEFYGLFMLDNDLVLVDSSVPESTSDYVTISNSGDQYIYISGKGGNFAFDTDEDVEITLYPII